LARAKSLFNKSNTWQHHDSEPENMQLVPSVSDRRNYCLLGNPPTY